MSAISDGLLQGPQSASQLIKQLGISQATFSRRLAAESEVIKFGHARATRYALRDPIRQIREFPLWQIDEQGKAWDFGVLYPVWPKGSCLVVLKNGESQWFDGLPWYLSDLRPQGFLGRVWGRTLAQRFGLEPDIRLWREADVLFGLASQEPEHLGGWLVGRESYQRWFATTRLQPVREVDKLTVYETLARRAMNGEAIGSSAGGEQPKFACYAETESGPKQVIVKFTPAIENANQQRWADLLAAESLALSLLNKAGISASYARLLRGNRGQTFLEVQRFDCQGEQGRRGIVSLESVQSEFVAGVFSWSESVARLTEQRIVDEATFRLSQKIWAFGRLVANSDMHAGNLSFWLSDFPLMLAPVYDMLPMAFAPASSGDMRQQAVAPVIDTTVPGIIWREVQPLAHAFWLQISQSNDVSEPFRRIAVDMACLVDEVAGSLQRLA